MGNVFAQPIRNAVFDGVVGVGVQREAWVPGELGEHGLDEVRHGVGAKVAGDEADAQGALGLAGVRVAWPVATQRGLEAVGEADVFFEEGLGLDLAAVAEAEEQAVVSDREVGLDGERLAVAGGGFDEPRLVGERGGKIAVGLGEVGLALEGAAAAGLRLLGARLALEGDGEVVVGDSQLGLELQNAPEAGLGLGIAVASREGFAKAEVSFEEVGMELDRVAKEGFGLGQVAVLLQDAAKVVAGLDAVGIGLEGAAEEGHSGGESCCRCCSSPEYSSRTRVRIALGEGAGERLGRLEAAPID